MKKISKLLFLILLMSNIMVNPVLADDDKTIIVACRHFPWLADSDTKGTMIDVLNEVGKRIGYKMNIHTYAPARAVGEFFDNGQYDLLCPVSDAEQTSDRADKFVRTSTVFQRRDTYFYLKSGPDLSQLESAKGKTVGMNRSGFEPFMKKHFKDGEVKLSWVIDNMQNAKMLLSGRIDIAFMNIFGGVACFKELQALDQVAYDNNNPVLHEDAFFALHNNDRGKMLNALISPVIDQLHKEGFIKKLGLE